MYGLLIIMGFIVTFLYTYMRYLILPSSTSLPLPLAPLLIPFLFPAACGSTFFCYILKCFLLSDKLWASLGISHKKELLAYGYTTEENVSSSPVICNLHINSQGRARPTSLSPFLDTVRWTQSQMRS